MTKTSRVRVQCLYEPSVTVAAGCNSGDVVLDVDVSPAAGRGHRLGNEVLADAQRLDPGSTDAGLVQGQLSDEEVATAVVQRFSKPSRGRLRRSGQTGFPGGAQDMKEHLRTSRSCGSSLSGRRLPPFAGTQ